MAETIKMKVDIQNLMFEAAREMKAPVYWMGFQVAEGCLKRITQRAVKIKDEVILEELHTLGLVTKEVNDGKVIRL